MQEPPWYNHCHPTMSSMYRIYLQPPGGKPTLLVEVDNPELSRQAVHDAVLRAASRRVRSRVVGRPGRPIRAWAPEYPEGHLFSSVQAFGEARGVSGCSVSQRMRRGRKPVPDWALLKWRFSIPVGLPVMALRGAYFLPEDEFQAVVDGLSTPAAQ